MLTCDDLESENDPRHQPSVWEGHRCVQALLIAFLIPTVIISIPFVVVLLAGGALLDRKQ